VVVWTASVQVYADRIIDLIDQDQVVGVRYYRDSCVPKQKYYVKDLRKLQVDLKDVLIIDVSTTYPYQKNSPQSFEFQRDNGLVIRDYFRDPQDRELFSLVPFLLYISRVEDVRSVMENLEAFNNRYQVAKVLQQQRTPPYSEVNT
jgi:Dullard-like phosphatase family protein